MSWADIRRKYQNGGASATQSTEDMAARRVLRALGVTEKSLASVERETGLDAERRSDSTLLERVSAVARASGNKWLYPLAPVRDFKSRKDAEDAVVELAEQCGWNWAIRPIAVVYRLAGTDELRAITCIGTTDILDVTRAPLPCRLFRSRDGACVLLDCDAQDFYNKLVALGVPSDG